MTLPAVLSPTAFAYRPVSIVGGYVLLHQMDIGHHCLSRLTGACEGLKFGARNP